MKPVFLVYTHTQPELLGRTVRRLAPYPVVVHVDAKVSCQPFLSAIHRRDRDRCHFLDRRVVVNWGGYSQVEAIRSLVAYAIDGIADEEDYLLMLSGQDYPIRPVHELHALLSSAPGAQYLRFFRVRDGGRKYTSQVDRYHFRDLRLLRRSTAIPAFRRARSAVIRTSGAMFNTLASPPVPPVDMELAHGGTHFALTARCLADLESSANAAYVDFMRHVYCPEENFYHTLLANSSYAAQTRVGGFEAFVGPANYHYANFHHIGPNLTRVFTADDFSEVEASTKFFVRKIALPQSETLLDLIDTELLGEDPYVEKQLN